MSAIHQKNGRVTGVAYDQDGTPGTIEADYVVNCAGMWGREVGKMAGVHVPLHAAEHFYIVTDSIEGLEKLPVLRVPDECAYYKEDAGKILLGAFEPNAKPWGMDGIPADFCFDELQEDFDHFEPILEAACNRMPMLAEAVSIPSSTALNPLRPMIAIYWAKPQNLAIFMSRLGLIPLAFNLLAGREGPGRMDCGREAPFDLWDVDIRRMQPFQSNKTYLFNRTKES